MVVATVLVGQWTDVVQTKILQKLFCTANHSANRMNPIDLVIPDFSSYWSDAEIEKWLKVCQFRLSGTNPWTGTPILGVFHNLSQMKCGCLFNPSLIILDVIMLKNDIIAMLVYR